MYYVVYNNLTNSLIYLDEVAFPFLEEGMTQVQHEGEMPRLDIMAWSPSSLSFYAKTVNTCTTLEFMSKFTMQERIAIRERVKVDPIAADIQDQLKSAASVTLTDSRVIQALQYFVHVEILTPTRLTEILS